MPLSQGAHNFANLSIVAPRFHQKLLLKKLKWHKQSKRRHIEGLINVGGGGAYTYISLILRGADVAKGNPKASTLQPSPAPNDDF